MNEISAPTRWTDVTDACRRIAESLSDANPVAHMEEFSMFEAMGAVELMDDKMDSCHGLSGPMHVDDIVKAAMPVALSSEAVLTCMQQLSMCEMAYFNGSSMVETIKMCIFMHSQVWPQIEALGDLGAVLLCFVKSVVKVSSTYYKFVSGADIYEEEDFHLGSKMIEADVGDVAADLMAGMGIAAALASAASDSGDNGEILRKIQSLLQLRIKMLDFFESADHVVVQALLISQRKRGAPGEEMDVLPELQRDRTSGFMEACRNVHSSTTALGSALVALRSQQDFCDVSMDVMSKTLLEDTHGIFQPKISKLISNNPTRTVIAPRMTDCFAMLEDICRQSVMVAQTVPGFLAVDTSYDAVLSWCLSTSKSKFHLAVRSLQWAMLHTVCSLGGIEALLIGSLKASWLPEAYTSKPLCHDWVSSIAKVAWDTLKIMCMFRYKCLVKLDGNVMSWNKISEDAPRVDQAMSILIYPAGTDAPAEIFWSTKWCLRILSVLLEAHLMLLTELDLVSGFELDSYYWFLEYITSTHIWSLRKLREMRFMFDKHMHQHAVAEAAHLVKAEKKNKKSTMTGKQLKDLKRTMESPPPVVVPAPVEEVLAMAVNHSYKAIVRIMSTLLQIGFIRVAPESAFTTKEIRFNCRYSLYRSISHITPVCLSDFARAINSINEMEPTAPLKLSSSSMALNSAKTGLDQLRKTQLSDVQPLVVSLESPSAFSIFKYTVDHSVSEKCIGLIKVLPQVLNFIRIYRTLTATFIYII